MHGMPRLQPDLGTRRRGYNTTPQMRWSAASGARLDFGHHRRKLGRQTPSHSGEAEGGLLKEPRFRPMAWSKRGLLNRLTRKDFDAQRHHQAQDERDRYRGDR